MTPSTLIAGLADPRGVAIDSDGGVYVSEASACAVLESIGGSLLTVAGGGGCEAQNGHLCAAAATSIARPVAPTRRIGSQLVGVAVLPPARWAWKRTVSSGACSTHTLFHSTSSSSAISIGSIVLTPCPISDACAAAVSVSAGDDLPGQLGEDHQAANEATDRRSQRCDTCSAARIG